MGPDHPDVATDLNNLAGLLQGHEPPRRGRAAAIAARWRSTRRASGRTIPMWRTASTISRDCSQATNRLDEAEPLFRRALAILDKSLGPDHPNTVARAQQPRRASGRARQGGVSRVFPQSWDRGADVVRFVGPTRIFHVQMLFKIQNMCYICFCRPDRTRARCESGKGEGSVWHCGHCVTRGERFLIWIRRNPLKSPDSDE